MALVGAEGSKIDDVCGLGFGLGRGPGRGLPRRVQTMAQKSSIFDPSAPTSGFETCLDRLGSSSSAGCSKTQPRRPLLGPFRHVFRLSERVTLQSCHDFSCVFLCSGGRRRRAGRRQGGRPSPGPASRENPGPSRGQTENHGGWQRPQIQKQKQCFC